MSTVTTAAGVPVAPFRQRRSRRRRLRSGAGVILTYVLVGILAIIVIFPFLFMVATSLKTSEEVFRSPPVLLPMQPVTVEVDGEELPLYVIPLGDSTVEMVPVQSGIDAGVFVDPDALDEPELAWPLQFATPVVDGSGAAVTVVIDGQPVPLADVIVAEETLRLAQIRDTAVTMFVDPNDPDVVSYAVQRTAVPVERPTANPGNFEEVLARAGFDRNLTNTLLVTILVVSGQLLTSILGGYAFARIRFPGRDKLFLVYLGSIMVPFVVLIIPLYQFMVAIGWVDKVPALVFPWIITAYGTFLMRQFFITIPRELEEAAFVDGASRWTILWRIFVPLSLPAVATLTTFSFLYAWNSFVWPFVIISTGNTEAQVLTVALQQFGGRAADSPQLVFAGVTIAVAVPVLAFLLVQRYYVENVSTSGIK